MFPETRRSEVITRIDPADFSHASTVQVESDVGNPWLALDEIEDWAAGHGFVRTSEYHPRQVLVDGQRRFRTVCYRMSDEELEAIEDAQRRMTERGDRLRGTVRHYAGGAE